MSLYHFTAYLADTRTLTDDDIERLYECGCDDGSPAWSDGIVFVGFDREADSLDNAIRSAIADVSRAGFRVDRIELESDDLQEFERATASRSA